ncbi:MAG: hypothetical protein OXF79_03685 [Chloroflexi bacterium]|nr:hypothetical protein [Chloroflexota bacterium]
MNAMTSKCEIQQTCVFQRRTMKHSSHQNHGNPRIAEAGQWHAVALIDDGIRLTISLQSV